MAFKMMGAPYPLNRKGKVNPNSEGNTDLKDGRSASAALQYSSPVKQTEDTDLETAEDYYMKNIKDLGLTKLLEEEEENLGTKVRGSYTDEEQASIDELTRRMREFEDNPK